LKPVFIQKNAGAVWAVTQGEIRQNGPVAFGQMGGREDSPHAILIEPVS